MSINIERSRSGLPCLWERGGGATNTGDAIIVAGTRGQRLEPLYIRRAGSLAAAEHALIPVAPGCHVVTARHHRQDFRIVVWRIIHTEGTGAFARVCSFGEGEWDNELDGWLEPAVEAAREKAACYHCREPHYII